MYSNQEQPKIKVKEILLSGENKINQKIISFSNLKKNSSEDNALVLSLETKKTNNITSKDNSGNPLTYQMNLSSTLTLTSNDKLLETKNFISSFSYSNKDNKFDLREYQENLENNLIRSISEKINMYLILRK
tara:strand:- start:183 stop:578 length:396 start_codon:yes stop_codon:yes gene_type:complete